MFSVVTAVAAPLLVILIFGFLIYRFGFLSGREVGGRASFIAGGIMLLFVSLWEVAELASDYSDWFVAGAYPLIEVAQFVMAAIGLLLAVVGLAMYADYWQERRTEVEERLGRLSMLDNLQHDSRQPYHLLEILNISLREILAHYPMTAGAVFLVNRAKRQFVLTSSSGLHKDEIAYLEYYPLERNVVSQAVELGDPMLLAQFDFYDRSGTRVASRFKSILIVPLNSGMERIGGLLLFSEEAQFFDSTDIRYLSPVALWLAEKMKSARLERLLAQTDKLREDIAVRYADLTTRLNSSSRSAAAPDGVVGFCRALVGLLDSESVHLCGLRQGALIFHGSSEPLFDLSENLRAALIEGIDRARPLIINQDTGEGGVVQSSLLCPVPTAKTDALLLVKSGRPFQINDGGLKVLDSFAQLAGLVLHLEDDSHMRLTRRKGFEAILEILQTESVGQDPSAGVQFFLETVARVFPRKTVYLAFVPDSASQYRTVGVPGQEESQLSDEVRVGIDEGGVGSVGASRQTLFVHGRAAASHHFDSYHDQARSDFLRFFGERGLPEFVAYCPISEGEALAVAMIAIYGMEESERAEWERLLTLSAGLCSLRLNMSRITRLSAPGRKLAAAPEAIGNLINELNNHLAAVIGTAELTAQDSRLPNEVRSKMREIVSRAELAAEVARKSMTTTLATEPADRPLPETISRSIQRELGLVHVSGNVYMAGQRPREIFLSLESVAPIGLAVPRFGELFRTVLNRFAALADEDDVFTVATYVRDQYVYLDVSRHRHNFPPVAPVVGFGRYVRAEEAFRNRPADIYLSHILDTDTDYSVDTASMAPAYLSFRFPVSGRAVPISETTFTATPRLLAIDDQQVILDLISAMGQSLGYEVRTALTGEEGLKLVERETFEAVLTDLALPGISGLEVARQISRRRPGLPIILVTGWSTETKGEELAEAGITEVLYKPFRIEQLTSVVRAVVAGRISS